jgi:hypothetical protein
MFGAWRAAAPKRPLCREGGGIGKKGLEPFDDKALEFGRRQALPRSGVAYVPFSDVR